MVMKDLERGTYEVCSRGDLDVVLPFNLAPKPDGAPFPWRVCQRTITVDDALDDVKTMSEGTRALPLISTEGCWMWRLGAAHFPRWHNGTLRCNAICTAPRLAVPGPARASAPALCFLGLSIRRPAFNRAVPAKSLCKCPPGVGKPHAS